MGKENYEILISKRDQLCDIANRHFKCSVSVGLGKSGFVVTSNRELPEDQKTSFLNEVKLQEGLLEGRQIEFLPLGFPEAF